MRLWRTLLGSVFFLHDKYGVAVPRDSTVARLLVQIRLRVAPSGAEYILTDVLRPRQLQKQGKRLQQQRLIMRGGGRWCICMRCDWFLSIVDTGGLTSSVKNLALDMGCRGTQCRQTSKRQ